MKKIIAPFFVAALLISFSSHAQTSAHQKHGAQMKQMLKDSLHLTDAQIDSVTFIRQEFMGKIKTIKQNTSLSADQKKEQVKPLREEMKLRLKNNLTEDQMKKMNEMQRAKRSGNMDEDNR
jgi:hypothetical protein